MSDQRSNSQGGSLDGSSLHSDMHSFEASIPTQPTQVPVAQYTTVDPPPGHPTENESGEQESSSTAVEYETRPIEGSRSPHRHGYPEPFLVAVQPSMRPPHCERARRFPSDASYLDENAHCTFCHRQSCTGNHMSDPVWYGVVWPVITNFISGPSQRRVIVICSEVVTVRIKQYVFIDGPYTQRLVDFGAFGSPPAGDDRYTFYNHTWRRVYTPMTTHQSREDSSEYQGLYQLLGKLFPFHRIPKLLGTHGSHGLWMHSENDELLFDSYNAFVVFGAPSGNPRRFYHVLGQEHRGIQTIGISGRVPYLDGTLDHSLASSLHFSRPQDCISRPPTKKRSTIPSY